MLTEYGDRDIVVVGNSSRSTLHTVTYVSRSLACTVQLAESTVAADQRSHAKPCDISIAMAVHLVVDGRSTLCKVK